MQFLQSLIALTCLLFKYNCSIIWTFHNPTIFFNEHKFFVDFHIAYFWALKLETISLNELNVQWFIIPIIFPLFDDQFHHFSVSIFYHLRRRKSSKSTVTLSRIESKLIYFVQQLSSLHMMSEKHLRDNRQRTKELSRHKRKLTDEILSLKLLMIKISRKLFNAAGWALNLVMRSTSKSSVGKCKICVFNLW